MNPVPRCAAVRARLHDLLDDLLDDPAERADLEAHLASCPACAEARERAADRLASLRTAWDVPGPAPDLPERARARAALSPPGVVRGGRLRLAATHVSAFVAGAAVAVLLRNPATPAPVPPPTRPAVERPAPPVAPTASEAPDRGVGPSGPLFAPRRIR